MQTHTAAADTVSDVSESHAPGELLHKCTFVSHMQSPRRLSECEPSEVTWPVFRTSPDRQAVFRILSCVVYARLT